MNNTNLIDHASLKLYVLIQYSIGLGDMFDPVKFMINYYTNILDILR